MTDLITSGKLFSDIGLPPLNVAHDRVMLCGNPELLTDMRAILAAAQFTEGSNSEPGHYVIEKAFVEK